MLPQILLWPVLLYVISATLPGCNASKRNVEEKEQSTEVALYRIARRKLDAKQYVAAVELFEKLESLYPFGRYAERAQLEIIYAHYRAYNLEEARAAADRFLRLHPTHPNADYAQYLKGLAGFTKGRKPFEMGSAGSLSERDLLPMKESFADFEELIGQFPNSGYATDSRQRMIFINNILAEKEIGVGWYYLKRNAFVAAANRGRYVIENYSQTPSVENALELLISSYTLMGQHQLAMDTVSVLSANYPDNHNLADDGSYTVAAVPKAGARSILNVVSFGLLAKPPEFELQVLPPATTDDSTPPQ